MKGKKKRRLAKSRKDWPTFVLSGKIEVGWSHKHIVELEKLQCRASSVKQAFAVFKEVLRKRFGGQRVYLGNCLIHREKADETKQKEQVIQLDLFEKGQP